MFNFVSSQRTKMMTINTTQTHNLINNFSIHFFLLVQFSRLSFHINIVQKHVGITVLLFFCLYEYDYIIIIITIIGLLSNKVYEKKIGHIFGTETTSVKVFRSR